jgi:UTP--glucose-1-phosphate uridylyltransferase
MSIRKAVIPAAGLGTRMLPAAKAVPKEMLPVLDRPVIQYAVEECADAGVDDLLFVISREKKALENHFRHDAELEERLAASGRSALLASINELLKRVKVHSVVQPSQRGLGDAVMQARGHVGNEPFLCLLGDAIFSGGRSSPARQLVEAHAEFGGSIVGLEEVAEERIERYGIVGGAMLRDGVFRIQMLVEKPSRDAAPSRLAIAARYVLSPEIFACIEGTRPGKNREIQLTDAMRLLLEREPVHGIVLSARRHDIGNPIDWLSTNLVFASRDPATWAALSPLLRELLAREASV